MSNIIANISSSYACTLRTGIGFDAHKFSLNTKKTLWLAGLQWDGQGIEGDSDGDVAIHALIDALLSAAQLGDIGTVFGVGKNSRGAGMSGKIMLAEVVALLQANKWSVQNASIIIIGNRPHISQRREEAQQILSEILHAPVSITATTTDGMGWTGNGEGLACQAQVLLKN
ncbi:MAG: 2-C-methyl-D-erythritol 2,4-cyclodiphosphate synthase [Bifidobacteriaceae bacterium]|nr:2-C-methyl-D-erythritol 2,4-cyclodiphosphate synthase [Bifidobacteriaceae bacterium]